MGNVMVDFHIDVDVERLKKLFADKHQFDQAIEDEMKRQGVVMAAKAREDYARSIQEIGMRRFRVQFSGPFYAGAPHQWGT